MSASVLFGVVLVKQAQAENIPSENAQTPTIAQLFLDQGFLGRDVDLNLQDMGVRATFVAGQIPKPGVFNIIRETALATSTADGERFFGNAWRLDWMTNAASAPTSVKITLDAVGCGANANKHCAIAETYQGRTLAIKPDAPQAGKATAVVRMGSVVRAVEVPGYMTQGDASWYAYKNCNCAASPDFAKGTYVLVTRLDDESKTVVVRINDWGPERDKFPKRVIDLDKVAFTAIGNPRGGLMQVRVLPLTPDNPLAMRAKAAENYVKPTAVATTQSTSAVAPVVSPVSEETGASWSL